MRTIAKWTVVAGIVTALFVVPSAQTPPPPARVLAEKTIEQLTIAVQEVLFAGLAASPDELRLRARRALNVLVGRNSPDFDAGTGNPGDGVGVVAYAQRLLQGLHEPQMMPALVLAADSVVFFVNAAMEHIKAATRANNLNRSRVEMRLALGLLVAARGSKEDPLSEGGARAILKQLLGPGH